MFFLLFFIIFFLLPIIVIVCSTICIEVEKLRIQIDKETKNIFNKDFKIIISFYFLHKIKYFKTILNDEKIKKKKININNMQNVIKNNNWKTKDKNKIYIIELLKKIQLKNIDFKIEIGTEDAAVTALTTGIFGTMISILLNGIAKCKNKWTIEPLYQNKNILKIDIDSIFKVKMINIIYTIYNLKKEG